MKELKERQKQQLRHKALKKGLDPEALTGKYPVSCAANHVVGPESNLALITFTPQPKIQVASKYERRVDTRSYDDKKKLFEGVSIRVPDALGLGLFPKHLLLAIWDCFFFYYLYDLSTYTI